MDAGDRGVKKLAVTSVAAMAAETTTFPVDLLKTRLQLHGESMQSVRPASALRIALQIARNDGVLGMYRGLSPAIFRHMFYTPTRIVGYEHLRNSFVRSSDRPLPFYGKAVIGGISGAIAQVFITFICIFDCLDNRIFFARGVLNSPYLRTHRFASVVLKFAFVIS